MVYGLGPRSWVPGPRSQVGGEDLLWGVEQPLGNADLLSDLPLPPLALALLVPLLLAPLPPPPLLLAPRCLKPLAHRLATVAVVSG
eukprot:3281337-Rhodomonas_salina.1